MCPPWCWWKPRFSWTLCLPLSPKCFNHGRKKVGVYGPTGVQPHGKLLLRSKCLCQQCYQGRSAIMEKYPRFGHFDTLQANPLGHSGWKKRAFELLQCCPCFWTWWQLHCPFASIQWRTTVELFTQEFSLIILFRTKQVTSKWSPCDWEWNQGRVQIGPGLYVWLACKRSPFWDVWGVLRGW